MPRRLGLIIPFALFALFLVLYTIMWNTTAGLMKREIAAFARSEAAAGRSFRYDSIDVRGYPLTLRASVENASWADNQGYGFTAERLGVVTLPYDASRILVAPRGDRTVTIRGEAFDLDAEGLLLSIEEGFAAIEAQNVRLTGEERTMEVGRIIANRQTLSQGATLAAELQGVRFGGETDVRVPYVRLSAGLVDDALNIGALDFAVTREDDPSPTQFSASGVLDADDQGLLSGELDVKVKNERPVILILAEMDFLGRSESQLLLSGLGLLTEQGTRATDIPLIFEDGEVLLGGLPVGRIPLGEIPPLTN